MKPQFWLDVWTSGEYGFHQSKFNPLMMKYFSRLDLKTGDLIFVPLCGKSIDMLWLVERGFRVLGIEISELACEQFFSENSIPVMKKKEGDFIRYSSEHVDLLCGDYFALTPALLSDVCGIYDRAALVALPMEMRTDYAKKMDELTSAPMLLLTFTYPEEKMEGPPFSVPTEEVARLYSARRMITHLEEKRPPESMEMFPEVAGEFYFHAYLLSACS